MVRNKTSTITKNKFKESVLVNQTKDIESQMIINEKEKKFVEQVKQRSAKICQQIGVATVDLTLDIDLPYRQNKFKLNSLEYISSTVKEDIKALKEDQRFKLSCGELALLPFVHQAIVQAEQQLDSLASPVKTKQAKSIKVGQQKSKLNRNELPELVDESPSDCFYFYQSSNG